VALAGLTPEARSGEAATEIRWQIEELRVSLFAQTIGTPLPVSERRIMTTIEQLN
jgi:ATP-dependent helicase HrpA